jgi:hypothetical protein
VSRAHLSGKHGRLALSRAVRRDCLLLLRDKALAGDVLAAAEIVKIGVLIDAVTAQAAADRSAA